MNAFFAASLKFWFLYQNPIKKQVVDAQNYLNTSCWYFDLYDSDDFLLFFPTQKQQNKNDLCH
jgi:hypothetical protein